MEAYCGQLEDPTSLVTYNLAVKLKHGSLLDHLLDLVAKAHLLNARNNILALTLEELTGRNGRATREHLVATNLHKGDRLALSRLETDGISSRRIEVHAVRESAVKYERRVGLDEGEVRADLDRAVALVLDLDEDAAAALGQFDLVPAANECAGKLGGLDELREREQVLRGNGEEGAVQRELH
jgi:hypothetical protein